MTSKLKGIYTPPSTPRHHSTEVHSFPLYRMMNPKVGQLLSAISFGVSDKGAMFPPINQAKERVLAPVRIEYNVQIQYATRSQERRSDGAANLLCDFVQGPSFLSLDLSFTTFPIISYS